MKKLSSFYSSEEALEKLREGNQHFVRGIRTQPHDILYRWQSQKPINEQHPFAVILGCSDSRVPAEIIFDQGLGDLFVIRVAGNIVAPSQIGSIEFAIERFGIRLIIVLGHTQCGLVKETLESLQHPSDDYSPHLRMLIERIRPSIALLLQNNAQQDAEKLLHDAIQANIHHSINQLLTHSAFLRQLNDKAHLRIVGAKYSLETGNVDFFQDRF